MDIVGGVMCTNQISPDACDKIFQNSIDLDFELYLKMNPADPYGDHYYNDNTTYVYGFKKNAEGLFEPDIEAEYSLIIDTNTGYTQVVRSRWVTECRWCSLCYPFQCDLDSQGSVPTYCLSKDDMPEGYPNKVNPVALYALELVPEDHGVPQF